MRKTILVLTVALFAIFVCSTTGSAGTFKYGVKAGVALGDQSWEYVGPDRSHAPDMKTAFAVGFFTEWNVIPNVSLRPELMYVQKGSQWDYVETDSLNIPIRTLTAEERIDYLSLTLAGKVSIPAIGPGLYVFGGPRLDIKVRDDSQFDALESADYEYESTVLGGTVGLGYQIGIGPVPKLFLEASYHHDFGDAFDQVGPAADEGVKIKNRALSVTLGFRF